MKFDDWSGMRRKGEAELAAIAPTADELAWWKTQRRRYLWPWVLLGAGPWAAAPLLSVLLHHHVSGEAWGHAIWMSVVVGGIFGTLAWRSGEPATCARELSARRLRLALMRPEPAPVAHQDREPVRLMQPSDR